MQPRGAGTSGKREPHAAGQLMAPTSVAAELRGFLAEGYNSFSTNLASLV